MLSQNRTEADRRGVIEGYRDLGPGGSDMADLVAERHAAIQTRADR